MFKALKSVGIDNEKLIQNCSLKQFDLSNSENYIPSKVLYDYLLLVRNSNKDFSFIKTFYSEFEIDELGNYGAFLAQLPTLQSALDHFIQYESIFQTNSCNGLTMNDDHAKFTFSLVDKFSPGRKIAENMLLAIILKIFKSFGAQDWEPIEFHTPYTMTSDIESILPKGKCIIKFNQPAYALVFSKSMLTREFSPSVVHKDVIIPKNLDTSFASIAEKVLNSYNPGSIPTLRNLANHFNISESTLKRSLKSNQSKFSDILSLTLYKKASILLAQSDMNIMLISEHLGYSDSPNFIRSFKKWTGTTPTLFRNNFNEHTLDS